MPDPFKTHGSVSWIELMTTDTEAAQQFYSTLFGWHFEDGSINEDDAYKVITPQAAAHPVGGVMDMPPECKAPGPTWGLYVTVDDVDTTVGHVTDLGGKVIKEPTDMPGVGRMAVIQDPQGAVISVITYEKGVQGQ
jgi:hypothetical protein